MKGYDVIFSDEFNAATFDSNKWKVGINAGNAIQGSQDSPYLRKGISQKNGMLELTASKEKTPLKARIYGGKHKLFNYSSGAINTDSIFELKGEFYIEIRCKFPENDGGYCAFWTMPSKKGVAEGMLAEDMHETDFFEFKTSLKKASHYRYFSSLWWHSVTEKELEEFPNKDFVKRGKNSSFITQQSLKPHYQPRNGKVTKGVDFSKYVTFGFKATKDQLSWHLVQDGTAYNAKPYMVFKGGIVESRTPKDKTQKPFKVHRPVPKFNNYLILNYRVSNQGWIGGPINDSQLPSTMKVDYVRVYKPHTQNSKKK